MFSGDIERESERYSFSKTAFNENYLKKETAKNRYEQ